MTYGIIPYILIAIFLIWLFYRIVIKKDVKQYRYGVFAGVVVIGIWMILYIFSVI